MAYGAEVTNSNGDVVFSTEDPVFQVIGKGQISIPLLLSSQTTRIMNDPDYNYNSGYNITAPTYSNGSAIGDWEDDVLTFWEVLSGERLYKYETADTNTGARIMNILSHNKTTARYVQVRIASNITVPSSGYGMVFYNNNGDVTWYDGNKVLDNVLPLTITTTSNRWYYFNGDPARTTGDQYTCGYALYRGIRGTSTGFVKEATNASFSGIAAANRRYTPLCVSYDRSTHGLSANIDWDTV